MDTAADAPGRRVTLTVNADRLTGEARLAGFRLTNAFLRQHEIYTRALAMRPAKLLVWLVIVTATVQKAMRRALPAEWHGRSRMQREAIGYISRRGIAAATGLPRENVRRIVAELAAEERLLAGPAGRVANRGGLMEQQQTMAIVAAMAAEVAATAQDLIRLGVIDVTDPGDPSAG